MADETGNLKEEEDGDQGHGDEFLNSREEKEVKRILRVAHRTGKSKYLKGQLSPRVGDEKCL